MFSRLVLACLSVALFACAAPAHAAEAVAPGWGDLLKPWLDMAMEWAILGLVGLIAAGFRRWFKVDLDERHRRTLHQALTTGADAAFAKLKSWAGEGLSRAEVEQRLLTMTIGHAQAGAADAVAHFRLNPADPRLINLALAKLKQAAPVIDPKDFPLLSAGGPVGAMQGSPMQNLD
jgi:hypothetical protein